MGTVIKGHSKQTRSYRTLHTVYFRLWSVAFQQSCRAVCSCTLPPHTSCDMRSALVNAKRKRASQGAKIPESSLSRVCFGSVLSTTAGSDVSVSIRLRPQGPDPSGARRRVCEQVSVSVGSVSRSIPSVYRSTGA